MRSVCSCEAYQSGVKLWFCKAMTALLSLGLVGERAVALPSTSPFVSFHTFHLPPLGQAREEQHYYPHSRWGDLGKSIPDDHPLSSKTGSGMGLIMVHRDAINSPFRSKLVSAKAKNIAVDSKAKFAAILQNSLQRDAARVRAMDSNIAKQIAAAVTSRRVHAAGPPLQSPIFPGQ
jgi:hypothetical protein